MNPLERACPGRSAAARRSMSLRTRSRPIGDRERGRGADACIVRSWVGRPIRRGLNDAHDREGRWTDGVAACGLTAAVLTVLVALRRRSRRAVLEVTVASLPTLGELVAASGAGWDDSAMRRL